MFLYNDLTYKIIGAAKEVYEYFGPGYLESVYEDALCYELESKKIKYQRQIELDIHYKNTIFKRKFKCDLLIDNEIIVENKAVSKLTHQDEAQLINYLKTTKIKIGLLFNFGSVKFEMLRRIK